MVFAVILYISVESGQYQNKLEDNVGLLENIQNHLRNLPESQLAEILELISSLEKKEESSEIDECRVWAAFSLERAMTGINEENEDVIYTLKDLKETYR